MKYKTIHFIILVLIFPITGLAQYDSIVNSFQKEFNSFNQSIQEKHKAFREKNDSIFSQFLKESWDTVDIFYKEKPVRIKPLVPPKIELQKRGKKIPSIEISIERSQNINSTVPIEKVIQVEKRELPETYESGGIATLDIDFYGNESKLNYPSNIPQIKRISVESISSYFDNSSGASSVYYLVNKLQLYKEKLRLNDWGYYKLVDCCIEKLEIDPSSKTLLKWIILIKSGYNVKIGLSGNKAYLLVPFREELFNIYSIKLNDQYYYFPSDKIIDDDNPKSIVSKADYPGNSLFSLIIDHLPYFGTKAIHKEYIFRKKKLVIEQNERLINFYREYPTCELKVYFSTPLSENTLSSLDNYFNPLFSGLTEKDKVALLLEFTQNAFSYQSDIVQFSREKCFFPDELFYYPFSDCEDRAVLFTKLVKHFTRFDCIALSYPGHVNTAVNFGSKNSGGIISLNNKKYTVCDPTYIDAPIGYLPDEFKGLIPKVINFGN
jgi:hypothetical protein